MAVQGFADLLFDGTLDFPCTFIPAEGASFATKAIIAFDGFDRGTEAGKGLAYSSKAASAEWKHFRVPSADFAVVPKPNDKLEDDNGVMWNVEQVQPSRAGTYMIYAKAGSRYKGVESGIRRT